MTSMQEARIAFLGTGLMGTPMVRRLLSSGFQTVVWNRTADKAKALEIYGAQFADTPAQAVEQADIVVTMLADGAAVRDVINAALTKLRGGVLVVDMSSTQTAEARALHAVLSAHNVAFVDAPVSGGVIGAEAGTLAIMAGGTDEDFHRAFPLFEVWGRATHVGPAGCGQLAKLCNQLIVGGTLALVAEALLLAQAGGANPAAVRSALRGGFAESRILEVHGQRMLDRHFLPGGKVASQTKDLENALIATQEAGLTLPLMELVTNAYRAMPSTLAGADQSAILLELERRNKGRRLGVGPDVLP